MQTPCSNTGPAMQWLQGGMLPRIAWEPARIERQPGETSQVLVSLSQRHCCVTSSACAGGTASRQQAAQAANTAASRAARSMAAVPLGGGHAGMQHVGEHAVQRRAPACSPRFTQAWALGLRFLARSNGGRLWRAAVPAGPGRRHSHGDCHHHAINSFRTAHTQGCSSTSGVESREKARDARAPEGVVLRVDTAQRRTSDKIGDF